MIENSTRKKKIDDKFDLCTSLWSKARGLMFRKCRTLVFRFEDDKKIGLHMLFVFYPIDVLWLDKDKKVIEIKERLKPFRFYTPKSAARYVVESKAGMIRRTGTKINDRIGF